jgi:hypothetical protein
MDTERRPENTTTDTPTDPDRAARAARWGTLPPRIDVADLVEEQPADPPNDPRFGRDPDNDWLLRSAP